MPNDRLLTSVNLVFSILAMLVIPRPLRKLRSNTHAKMHTRNVHRRKESISLFILNTNVYQEEKFNTEKTDLTYFNTQKNCLPKTMKNHPKARKPQLYIYSSCQIQIYKNAHSAWC